MKASDVIEPARSKPGKWSIGTLDIETIPTREGESALLGDFCVGATCEDFEGETVRFYTSFADIIVYILKRQDTVRWYCHNGGNFDYIRIIHSPECLRLIHDKGYSVIVVGGEIAKGLMLKRGKKCIYLCDSFKLMNVSLDKLSKGFKVSTPKGHIDFDKEDFDPSNPLHMQYLADDVISLYQVCFEYRHIINKYFDIDPKMTASSTAFLAWQKTLLRKVYKHPQYANDMARKAYYGGRTECFLQGTAYNTPYIDVNSLYPYCMIMYGGLCRPYKTYQLNGPGFYHIKAHVPDMKICPLPYRKKDGTGVLFPTGDFETYASSVEIELAIERGCTIEVIEGVAFEFNDTELFRPFIEKCMELRHLDYSGAIGIVAKFLQNNLYGFFGMKPIRDELVFSEMEPSEPGFTPMVNQTTGEVVYNIWVRKAHKDSINCIPAFAAWITANARVHITRAMYAEQDAGNNILYCDTDSIVMEGDPVSRIAEGEYGAFKLEWIFDKIQFISGKAYMGRTDEEKIVIRCKGIPARTLSKELFAGSGIVGEGWFKRAFEGEKIEVLMTQLNSLARVAKTGSFGNANSKRTMPTFSSMTTRRSASRKGGATEAIKLPYDGY